MTTTRPVRRALRGLAGRRAGRGPAVYRVLRGPVGRRAGIGLADRRAGLLAVGLFALAVVTGALAGLAGHPVHAAAAPLFGHWLPHAGPGTPAALAIAALLVWRGPHVAARLRWRPLLAAGYAAAVGWTLALALVDGWHRGLAARLTTRFEYLSEVGGVTDVPAMLRIFAARILDGSPGSWTTHVAGHPPGALLVFVGLDRIGLGGGGWAALACVLVGSLTAVAVPITLRALGSERAARAALPFVVLFPGAVWVGASADGLFAGVGACGLALLAVGLTRSSRTGTLAAGVLLASAAYLSYGLVLLAPLVLAVVVLAARAPTASVLVARAPTAAELAVPAPTGPTGQPTAWIAIGRLLVWAAIGAAAVVVAWTAAGFWWFDGYLLVKQRYYQGLAAHRPYAYWVWGNLAALAAAAGPASAAVLRRAAVLAAAPARRAAGLPAAVLLPLGALAAMLFADLSGLSKAEVERIWLPFAVWLPAGAVLLPVPSRRGWLAVQAGTALLVNHLLLTGW